MKEFFKSQNTGKRKIYTFDRNHIRFIVIIIIVLLILSFGIGNMFGTYTTTKAVAKMAGGFIDRDLILQAINQYKHNIRTCYPSLIL